MSKQHFKYNPESLAYEAVKVSVFKKILRGLLWIAPSLVLGLLLAIFFTRRIDSPKEKQLRLELKANNKEVKRMQADLIVAHQALDVIQGRDEDLYRAALFAKEFPEELRQMGTGGSERYAYLKDLSNADLLISTSEQIDKLEKRLHAQSISFRELLALAKKKEEVLACIPAIQPVNNKDLKRMVSG